MRRGAFAERGHRGGLSFLAVTQSFFEFKRSLNTVSRGIKRVNQYVPCFECGHFVRRSPSQIRQAKHIFCSRYCQARFYQRETYQGSHKCVNQRAFGVSLTIAKAFAYEVDPWQISKREVAPA